MSTKHNLVIALGALSMGIVCGIGIDEARRRPVPPKIVKQIVQRTDCPKLQEQWNAAEAACTKHDGVLRNALAEREGTGFGYAIECQAQCTKDNAIPLSEIK